MGERACVVGGAAAWPFYLANGAWVGQENRRFGNAERLGFYSGREVHGALPRIEHVVGSVPLTVEEAAARTLGVDPVDRRVGEVLAAALHEGMTTARVAVVLLSSAEDSNTVTIDPVPHDGDAAWTMFQRVVDVDRLRAASSTAELGAG
jgi:hypothetical protein